MDEEEEEEDNTDDAREEEDCYHVANDNRIVPDESVLNLLILKVSTNHTDADCKVNSINDSTIDGYEADNVYNNDTRFEILQSSGLINKRQKRTLQRRMSVLSLLFVQRKSPVMDARSSFFYPKIIICWC